MPTSTRRILAINAGDLAALAGRLAVAITMLFSTLEALRSVMLLQAPSKPKEVVIGVTARTFGMLFSAVRARR